MVADDDEELAEQEKKAKAGERARQVRDDFLFVVGDVRGRRFLWRMLEQCHVFQPIFRTSAEMAHLEGQRNVGLRVLSMIQEHQPEALLAMMREKNDGNS